MGKVLSIFVDESGRFQFPDMNSRFYILGLVLHDQSQPVDGYVADLQSKGDNAVNVTTAGYVNLNDSWTTDLHFKPDPSKPFRFSMIEYPDRRFSNAEFERCAGDRFFH